MKRKLPQWLLDATNNNNDSINKKTEQTEPAQHSNPKKAESDQIQPNGKITVVPLSNLLSQSRCVQVNCPSGVRVNGSDRTSEDTEMNVEMRTAESTSTGNMPLPLVIKTEIDQIAPSPSNAPNEQPQVVVKQEIKDEPVDTATSNTTPTSSTSTLSRRTPTSPTPTLIAKIENVKPERRSCNYGIKCFRQNAAHRNEMAHPGDVDYRRPSLPTPPIGTPPCPWGTACYRRNPQHFIQLSHPPATSAATVTAVPQPNVLPRRNRNNAGNNRMAVDNDSDAEDDYDLEDPFIDNGSSDEYLPDEDDDDQEDTQLTDN